MISIIAAKAEDNLIGDGDRLPWHLPADLAHFKKMTMGKPMLMGRKTWESLPGLLPGRPHWVVSTRADYQAPGARLFGSLEAAFAALTGNEDLMVIGGAEIYRQALAHADRLLITEIVGRFQGDCYFPPIDPDIWQRVESIPRPADAANPCRMSFDTYRRRAP